MALPIPFPRLGALLFLGAALLPFPARTNPQVNAADVDFQRGDVNADGELSTSDILMLRRFVFNGGLLPCLDAADFDDDGAINLTDAIFLLRYVFLGGAAPAPPFPEAGPDPTEDRWSCESYSVAAPTETDDVIRLGDFFGSPGEAVEVPVYVKSREEVEAFQLVIRYDPAVFSFTGAEDPSEDALAFSGTFYDGRLDEHNLLQTAVAHPDDETLTLLFIPSMRNVGFELPAGEELLAFKIRGSIAAGAPDGGRFFLEPTSGEDDEGFGPVGLRNELTHRGEARFVSTSPRTIGALGIVGDQTFFRFIRGDANGDSEMNVTDALFTLDYLFVGEAEIRCMDAADTNDDGRVDLSDPVSTLMALFVTGASRLEPYPEPGFDRTFDELGCERGSS